MDEPCGTCIIPTVSPPRISLTRFCLMLYFGSHSSNGTNPRRCRRRQCFCETRICFILILVLFLVAWRSSPNSSSNTLWNKEMRNERKTSEHQTKIREAVIKRVTRISEPVLRHEYIRMLPSETGSIKVIGKSWNVWHFSYLFLYSAYNGIHLTMYPPSLFTMPTSQNWGDWESKNSQTAGVNLRILFDSIDNGGIFHCVRASWPRLVYESRVSSTGPSEPAPDSADGSDGLSIFTIDVSNGCRRSGVTMPFVEDDGFKTVFWDWYGNENHGRQREYVHIPFTEHFRIRSKKATC